MTRNADQDLVTIMSTAIKTYMGDRLQIGSTSGWCSDQQSFYQNGYPAMGVFESPGNRVFYPHYHRPTDEVQYLDIGQMELLGEAFMTGALIFAEVTEREKNLELQLE